GGSLGRRLRHRRVLGSFQANWSTSDRSPARSAYGVPSGSMRRSSPKARDCPGSTRKIRSPPFQSPVKTIAWRSTTWSAPSPSSRARTSSERQWSSFAPAQTAARPRRTAMPQRRIGRDIRIFPGVCRDSRGWRDDAPPVSRSGSTSDEVRTRRSDPLDEGPKVDRRLETNPADDPLAQAGPPCCSENFSQGGFNRPILANAPRRRTGTRERFDDLRFRDDVRGGPLPRRVLRRAPPGHALRGDRTKVAGAGPRHPAARAPLPREGRSGPRLS